MRIVFVHNGLPIDGDRLARGPLGGTETALILLAKALAEDPDHEVHIFCNTEAPGPYAGVHYHRLGALGTWAPGRDVDVLVSVREWLAFLVPVRARYRVLWSPDAYDQPSMQSALRLSGEIEGEETEVPILAPGHFLPDVDQVFCVGHWQAEGFAAHLGFPEDKLHVTRNGLDLRRFAPRPHAARRKRLVYTSTPFRGLDHLLSYWPALRAECPGLSLEVCSSMAVYGVPRAEDERAYGPIYEAMDALPGVYPRGSLRQDELARVLCQGLVFAYPSTFPETFCIAVAEAQAAGLPVVTSAHSALRERVEHNVDGFLIPGQPGEAGYQRRFIEAVRALVTDRALWQRMSEAGRRKAERLGYGPLAREWTEHFERAIDRRPIAHKPAAAALRLEGLAVPHPRRPQITAHISGEQLRQVLHGALAAYGFPPGDN